MNHSLPVIAMRVCTADALFDQGAVPGSFFIDDAKNIHFNCPCGCCQYSALPLYHEAETKPVGVTAWKWDGNLEVPTLDPSIRQMQGCKFHGFLKQGVWTFCGDSGR